MSQKLFVKPLSKRFLASPIVVVLGLSLGLMPLVRATDYQTQINNLNAQNASSQTALNVLEGQAATYQNQVDQLQQQIDAINAAIAANQAQQVNLQSKIADDEQQITQAKSYLAADVKSMYVNGQMSTIEELATSNDLSDYVDKEENRTVIQDKLNDLLTQIQQLQTQAQSQKQQIDTLLSTEKSQQSQLDSDQASQNNLLSLNQSQQNQYNSQISNNNSQINSLKKAQAAANASIAKSAKVVGASGGSGGACDIGSGNGGYPLSWCNATQDSFDDSNGFPVRECTSFAYWYFTSQEGQTGFRASGNAGAWWETSNYPVTTYPNVSVGALGIEPGTTSANGSGAPVPSLHGSYYGHVMVVKALPGQNYSGYGTVPSGYVLVASMNEDEAGHFMYNLWPVNYLMYINPK